MQIVLYISDTLAKQYAAMHLPVLICFAQLELTCMPLTTRHGSIHHYPDEPSDKASKPCSTEAVLFQAQTSAIIYQATSRPVEKAKTIVRVYIYYRSPKELAARHYS